MTTTTLSLLELADQIAANSHKGQVDKAGEHYVRHPRRVSAMGVTENEKIVGLLHDVVEDSSFSLEDLRKAGFPGEIIEAIDCLTKRQGEQYKQYLNRIKGNRLAKIVKLHDLADNSDPNRLQKLTILERGQLIDKYSFAKDFLLSS